MLVLQGRFIMMKRHKYTVDRIEGDIAVLLCREDESVQCDVPVKDLPKGLGEGDIVSAEFENGKAIGRVAVLKEETDRVREDVRAKIERLVNK